MTTKSYFEELEKEFGGLSFGDSLKSFRESLGLTQAALADMLELSVQNLCDIEKGRRIPSPSRTVSIAQKLNLPEKGMIELAIRDSLQKDGFNYSVHLGESA
jgi:transcriptional regulator with XRE-family HTH domain